MFQLLKYKKGILALVAGVALLAGCATLTSPKTNSQRLAYAEAQVTAIANSAATLYEAGVLKDTERDAILSQLDSANTALDTAWVALRNGNLDTVNGVLLTVDRSLLALRKQLADAQSQPASGDGG